MGWPETKQRTILITKPGCPDCEEAKKQHPDAEVYELWQGLDKELAAILMSTAVMEKRDTTKMPLVFKTFKTADGDAGWYTVEPETKEEAKKDSDKACACCMV